MSEIQVKEHGGGKKARQKRHDTRVDFTPMVDMNMLLITFFMFCTTMLKPQVMNLSMPSTEKPEPGQELKARESSAITIIMGANNMIYYYEGMLDKEEKYKDSTLLIATTYGEEGIRQVLLRKNEGTYRKIQELKIQRDRGEITPAMYDTLSTRIQREANEVLKIAPTVLIKPLDESAYANMVDILDEILITNIGFYQVTDLSDGDRYLYYTKTGDENVLSPEQKAQVSKLK